MVRDGSSLGLIALGAAALAYLVAPPHSVAAAKDVSPHADVLAVGRAAAALPISVAADVSVPGYKDVQAAYGAVAIRLEARTRAQDSKRAKVPVGCERVISGLVRSAMASQIARCVT